MQIILKDNSSILPLELRITHDGDDFEWNITEIEIWVDGTLRSDDNPLESFAQSTQMAIIGALNEWHHERRQAQHARRMAAGVMT